MTDHSQPGQSSPLVASGGVAIRPQRTAERKLFGGRLQAGIAVASVVAINAWAFLPSSDNAEEYVALPEVSAAGSGAVGMLRPHKLVRAELVQLETTPGPRSAAGPVAASNAYPDLADAVAHVPVKAKLQVLLALLGMHLDPEQLPAVEAKLRALLKLPDFVLQQLLQHPDLADFKEMLDAVFFGDSDLWWLEEQVYKIDVVPMADTSDRIDVNGKPAFAFEHAPNADGSAGGQPTGTLTTLPSSSPWSSLLAPAPEESAQVTMVSKSAEGADMATVAAQPTWGDLRMTPFSAGAALVTAFVPPLAKFIPVQPAPTPPPPPAPTPTDAEESPRSTVTGSTNSPSVFTTGNRFEPGSTVADSTTTSGASETSTPSTTSADDNAESASEDGNADSAPSGDADTS